MTVKHECSTKIHGDYRDVSGAIYPCRRPATVQRDGKWYCWQHDPERVKADKEKRRAAWNAKADRQTAIWKCRARNTKLAALVTPELAELLEQLAIHVPYTLHTGIGIAPQARQARALAARIREALAREAAE